MSVDSAPHALAKRGLKSPPQKPRAKKSYKPKTTITTRQPIPTMNEVSHDRQHLPSGTNRSGSRVRYARLCDHLGRGGHYLHPEKPDPHLWTGRSAHLLWEYKSLSRPHCWIPID